MDDNNDIFDLDNLSEEEFIEWYSEASKANREFDNEPKTVTNILNPHKAKIVRKNYEIITKLLKKNEADYTIEFQETLGTVCIQILTDSLDATDDEVKEYVSVIDSVDEITQNIYDDKIAICLYISDVFINVDDNSEIDIF